jgi:hypothetical protein
MEMAIRGNQNKWLTVDVAEFIPEFVDCPPLHAERSVTMVVHFEIRIII